MLARPVIGRLYFILKDPVDKGCVHKGPVFTIRMQTVYRYGLTVHKGGDEYGEYVLDPLVKPNPGSGKDRIVPNTYSKHCVRNRIQHVYRNGCVFANRS